MDWLQAPVLSPPQSQQHLTVTPRRTKALAPVLSLNHHCTTMDHWCAQKTSHVAASRSTDHGACPASWARSRSPCACPGVAHSVPPGCAPVVYLLLLYVHEGVYVCVWVSRESPVRSPVERNIYRNSYTQYGFPLYSTQVSSGQVEVPSREPEAAACQGASGKAAPREPAG